MDLKYGDTVSVRAHTSEVGKGLTYPAFQGILLEDAGVSEGWDVVDVSNGKGERFSIYCFSIERSNVLSEAHKKLTYDQAERLYRQGGLTEAQWLEYCHLWQSSAPRFGFRACDCAECLAKYPPPDYYPP